MQAFCFNTKFNTFSDKIIFCDHPFNRSLAYPCNNINS